MFGTAYKPLTIAEHRADFALIAQRKLSEAILAEGERWPSKRLVKAIPILQQWVDGDLS